MKISLLSPAFPPDFDAIGHYSQKMANQLVAGGHEVSVLTSEGERREQGNGEKIIPCIRYAHASSLRQLPKAVSDAAPDWLVVQFNPFGFGRRGFCPQLPLALAKIRRRGRTRVAIMFHETMVPAWPWKFFVMFCWQYPTFRMLCRGADATFVSTGRWIPQVRAASRVVPCHHLPVGSNVPKSRLTAEDARRNLGIAGETLVLGVFGQNHASRPLDWIAKAAAAVRQDRAAVLVYIGPDGRALREACPGLEILDCGVQPAEGVGDRLRAMDVLLSPFADGASTRRGSLVAALQHGVPVATTRRRWTDQVLLDSRLEGLLLSPAEDGSAFALEARAWVRRGDCLRRGSRTTIEDFHDKTFAWPVIAGQLVEGLREAGPGQP